jgi:RNA polymerase sigma factor (sigma-70 family)
MCLDTCSNEELAGRIASEMAQAREAVTAGNRAAARRHRRRARALIARLWQALLPSAIEPVARRFAPWTAAAGYQADDLVQESYPKLCRAIGRYSPGRASVAAWFRVTMANLCISLGRRRRETSCADLTAQPAPEASRAARLAALRTEARALAHSLAKDRPALRLKVLVFVRYYLRGWSMPRLARHHGVAPSTVHSWLHEVRLAVSRRAVL